MGKALGRIGPDGTVYPNHHKYGEIVPQSRLTYELLMGEDGEKHADVTVTFSEIGNKTTVRLSMLFTSAGEFQAAKGFGAEELGQQTLAKLERMATA